MPDKIKIRDIYGEDREYTTPKNIKIRASDGESEVTYVKDGVDTTDANATPEDILLNKTAYVQGQKITGTKQIVTQNKSVNIYENGETVISKDYGYDGMNEVTVNVDVDLPISYTGTVTVKNSSQTYIPTQLGFNVPLKFKDVIPLSDYPVTEEMLYMGGYDTPHVTMILSTPVINGIDSAILCHVTNNPMYNINELQIGSIHACLNENIVQELIDTDRLPVGSEPGWYSVNSPGILDGSESGSMPEYIIPIKTPVITLLEENGMGLEYLENLRYLFDVYDSWDTVITDITNTDTLDKVIEFNETINLSGYSIAELAPIDLISDLANTKISLTGLIISNSEIEAYIIYSKQNAIPSDILTDNDWRIVVALKDDVLKIVTYLPGYGWRDGAEQTDPSIDPPTVNFMDQQCLLSDDVMREIFVIEGTGGGQLPGVEDTVDLDMGEGDQEILPPPGANLSKVTIIKPETLIPENIKRDVNIGGVIGELISSSTAGEYKIRFIDYDGTILQEDDISTIDELNNITAPNLPDYSEYDHDNQRPALTFQEWNLDWTSITELNQDIDIGAIYETSDGKTYLYFNISYVEPIDIYFTKSSADTLTITTSWGEVVSNSTSSTGINITINPINTGKGYIIIESLNNYSLSNTSNNNIFGLLATKRRISSSLINVYLSDSVTSIGTYTFRDCQSLSSINIPDTVTSIGDNAFYNCNSLSSINIPDDVTSINSGAFYLCYSLSSINLPDDVTSINSGAFRDCYSLSSINLPDTVTSIGDNAFRDCYSLSSINLPDTVTSIGDNAFYNCNSLSSINIPDGVTSIGRSAFGNCYSLSSINIPDSVTSIGNYTFSTCTSLSSINIPDSVTSIGTYAFQHCYSLSSINIPDSITSIGNYTFSNCTSLSSINIPDSVTSIGTYAFNSCNSLSYINIPDTVTSIGNNAFYLCRTLQTINIPEGVTSIGTYTFRDCQSLSSINIPDTVTSIGTHAFRDCQSLSSINIPDSVTSIDANAFQNCYSLSSINIPNGVTSIGTYTFSDCTSLIEVILLPDSVITLSNVSAFNSNDPDRRFYVPEELLDDYKTATNWSTYASVIFPLSEYPGYWAYDVEDEDYMNIQSAYNVDDSVSGNLHLI